METAILIHVGFILGAICGWLFRDMREQRWVYSVRMEDGVKPVPVRQTEKPPPTERYQEWRWRIDLCRACWVDVPYAKRGPWYHEHYPLQETKR